MIRMKLTALLTGLFLLCCAWAAHAADTEPSEPDERIISGKVAIDCFDGHDTKEPFLMHVPKEDRSWHLLTTASDGHVQLTVDLTKHECQFMSDRAVVYRQGQPLMPESSWAATPALALTIACLRAIKADWDERNAAEKESTS